MDFQKTVTQALEILQLKEPTIHQIAQDRGQLRNALLCVGAGALFSSLGLVLFPVTVGLVTYRPDLSWVLGVALGAALAQMVVLFGLGLLAERVFHAKLTAQGFFQVLGFASLLNVLGVVPGLGWLASVWQLVVMGKTLHSEGRLEAGPIALCILALFLLFGSFGYYQVGYY